MKPGTGTITRKIRLPLVLLLLGLAQGWPSSNGTRRFW